MENHARLHRRRAQRRRHRRLISLTPCFSGVQNKDNHMEKIVQQITEARDALLAIKSRNQHQQTILALLNGAVDRGNIHLAEAKAASGAGILPASPAPAATLQPGAVAGTES